MSLPLTVPQARDTYIALIAARSQRTTRSQETLRLVCLADVYRSDGTLITNHVWVPEADFSGIPLDYGTMVKFSAETERYFWRKPHQIEQRCRFVSIRNLCILD